MNTDSITNNSLVGIWFFTVVLSILNCNYLKELEMEEMGIKMLGKKSMLGNVGYFSKHDLKLLPQRPVWQKVTVLPFLLQAVYWKMNRVLVTFHYYVTVTCVTINMLLNVTVLLLKICNWTKCNICNQTCHIV